MSEAALENRIDQLEGQLDEALATSEGRRKELERVAAEKNAEWKRAENAEAEVARLTKALREIKNFATEEWIVSCARRALKDAE